MKQEKIHDWTCNLEPAAIRFMLEHLQEFARGTGCFLLAFFKNFYPMCFKLKEQRALAGPTLVCMLKALKNKVSLKWSYQRPSLLLLLVK